MNGLSKLAQPDLRSLLHGGDIADAHRRSVSGGHDGILDVLDGPHQPNRPHINLLQTDLDEAASAICVIVRQLLFHLSDTYAVGDQLIGSNPNLILAGGPAEARYIDHVLARFELFLDDPVEPKS